MPIKIGLTGGLGSGKTIVASLLEVIGIPVYIADEESKRLTNSSPEIKDILIALFGEELYKNGELNRPKLASLIFGNEENIKKTNAIIHPVVNKDFIEWTKRQKSKYCAIESAILFESGFNKIVDVTLLVSAPVSLRIERALQRNPLAEREDIESRIQHQLHEEELVNKVDYVIVNDDIQAVIPQVSAFLNSLEV